MVYWRHGRHLPLWIWTGFWKTADFDWFEMKTYGDDSGGSYGTIKLSDAGGAPSCKKIFRSASGPPGGGVAGGFPAIR